MGFELGGGRKWRRSRNCGGGSGIYMKMLVGRECGRKGGCRAESEGVQERLHMM